VDSVRTEKNCEQLDRKLIILNLNEPLEFHANNLIINKINLKKSRIRKMLYNRREEKYPKDEDFLKL